MDIYLYIFLKWLTGCLAHSKGKYKQTQNVNVDAFSESECECYTAENSNSI